MMNEIIPPGEKQLRTINRAEHLALCKMPAEEYARRVAKQLVIFRVEAVEACDELDGFVGPLPNLVRATDPTHIALQHTASTPLSTCWARGIWLAFVALI